MKTTITHKHFEALHEKYGNHSDAARALGTTPSNYRHVRATMKMSGPLRAAILRLAQLPCQE